MRDFLPKNEEKSVAKGDKMEAPQPAPTIDESTGLPEEEAKQGDEGVVSPQSFPIGAKVRIHVSRLKRKFDGQLAEVESVGQKFVKVRMLTGPSMTETKQFLPTCIKLKQKKHQQHPRLLKERKPCLASAMIFRDVPDEAARRKGYARPRETPPCFATSYAMERIAGGWLLKYKSGHCG